MLGWRKDVKKDSEPQPGAPGSASSGAGAPSSSVARDGGGSAAAAAEPAGAYRRLGDMLFEEGHITRAQLDAAIQASSKDGIFVGKALVDLGFVDQKTLQSFLVKQCKIPHISLLDYEINSQLLKLVPEAVCRKHHLLPIDKLGRILTVAMVDPLDAAALEEVRSMCPDLKVKPILCDWDHFVTVSRRIFTSGDGPREVSAKSFGLAEKPDGPKAGPVPDPVSMEDAVDALLQQAAVTSPKLKSKAPEKVEPVPEKPVSAKRDSAEAQRPAQKIAPVGDEPLIPDFDEALQSENEAPAKSKAPAVAAGIEDLDFGALEAEPVPTRAKVEMETPATPPAPAVTAEPVAAPSGLSVEQLSTQMRAGIEQVMQRAVDGLAAQIREAKAEIQAPAVPSSQDLSRMVHENVQDAVQQTLAPVLARMDSEKGPVMPSAQELAAAIGGSVREAVQGTVGSLAKELHEVVSRQESNTAAPSAQDLASVLQDGIRGAMQEAVAAITIQAKQSLSPASSAPSAAELGETIRGSVQSAMTDVVAALTEHTRQIAAPRSEPAGPSPQEMAEAVRSSVQEAMKEVTTVMAEQTRQMTAMIQDDGPSAEELANALGTSVRDAMREGLKSVGENVMSAALQSGAPLQEALAIQTAQTTRITEEVHKALEAMREAMMSAQAAQDTRETRLEELIASMKPAPAPVSAPEPDAEKSGTIAQFPEGGRRGGDERYASVTVLRRREEDAKEALLDSAVLGHSDERVRAALEAESTLEQYTFENYLVGKANAFTVTLGKAVAEAPGREYNPFFLYGEVGTGKTHLINAIANHVQRNFRDTRVGYVSAGRFARRLMEALKDAELDAFRENYCHCDLLVFDDIQFLAGHDEVQEEFFHIFNALQLESRQIIIAADKAPDKLGQLEKRLVSRFSGGIVASLVPPDWETRMKIMRQQAKESLVVVPEEILALIATRVPNDIRKMGGCLRKVIAFAKLMDRELTCDLAGEILTHLGVEAA
ncbi:MAG: DnaA/Hda family protein [FCB group bacterium]|jgi:chromosomal replication initiator protein DnaA|nr:DnaA/Hda family protein [FCB group bacterium]